MILYSGPALLRASIYHFSQLPAPLLHPLFLSRLLLSHHAHNLPHLLQTAQPHSTISLHQAQLQEHADCYSNNVAMLQARRDIGLQFPEHNQSNYHYLLPLLSLADVYVLCYITFSIICIRGLSVFNVAAAGEAACLLSGSGNGAALRSFNAVLSYEAVIISLPVANEPPMSKVAVINNITARNTGVDFMVTLSTKTYSFEFSIKQKKSSPSLERTYISLS